MEGSTMDPGPSDGQHRNQAVDRALEILRLLAAEPQTASAVARSLDVHRSTGLRLLQTLERQSFVHRELDGRYRLGSTIFILATAALEELDIRRVAAPHLARLNRECGETVHLGIWEDGAVIYIDKLEGSAPVRMWSRVGKQALLHCTGVAKAILAFRPEDERRRVAASIHYTHHTPRTLTTSEALLTDLDGVRERGYAIDDSEHEEMIHCLAAPIRDAAGSVAAAVSLASPVRPMTELMPFVPLLLDTTGAISRELGWSA
jgi:DNA-binding IclR family transcriptional regulator